MIKATRPRASVSALSRTRERGASVAEYVVVVGLIAIVVIAGLKLFGATVHSKVDAQSDCLNSLNCGGKGNVSGVSPGGMPSRQEQIDAQAGKATDQNGPQTAQPGHAQATPPPPPPPAEPPSRGVGTRALDFGKGVVVDGLWGTITGLYHVVRHPIQTVEGVGHAIAHPIDTGSAIKDAVVKSWNENPERTIGAGIFEVATIFVAPAKVGKVGKAAELAEKAGEAAKLAEKAAELAKLEKAAEAARLAEKAAEASKALKAAEKAEAAIAAARKTKQVQQATKDLEQLYKDAAVAQKELGENATRIATETGGRPVVPDKLKGIERAQAKIASDYGGDASKILDLSRASIEYETVADLEKGFAKIQETYGDKLVRVKDRFADVGPTGYRDMLLNVESANGHVSELQIHLKQILEVKEGPGHALYAEAQAIERTAKEAGRALTAEEAAKLEEIVGRQKQLYDAAYEAAKNGPKPPVNPPPVKP